MEGKRKVFLRQLQREIHQTWMNDIHEKNTKRKKREGLIKMTMNENNQRVITINSNSPEWTVRMASKLLLGKGKWEVLWGATSIKITVPEENLGKLAKAMTSLVIQHGIEICGDRFYADRTNLWSTWKTDARFTGMLMSEDVFTAVQKEVHEQLLCSDFFLVTVWVKSVDRFNDLVKTVEEELKQEGEMARKLQEYGCI